MGWGFRKQQLTWPIRLGLLSMLAFHGLAVDAWAPTAAAVASSNSMLQQSLSGGQLVGQVSGSSDHKAMLYDQHSFANYQQVQSKHLQIALNVDFTRQQLTGYVEHQLTRLDPTVNRLVLDSKGLKIAKVEISPDGANWRATRYLLGLTDPLRGQPLNIQLAADTQRVRVYYQTSADASGLQWLTARQTTDKKQPFLYSQSQTIHARSWLPIQDTPAVRLTYEAQIQTPAQLLAVMSADNSQSDKTSGLHRFVMPQAIPAYLIALAVGDLSFEPITDRIGVYSEKSQLKRAVSELTDVSAMMQVASRLYGQYPWQRYDVLILPASYPFGGMENPRLSFITPTVLTGDNTLVMSIAHELAHSWSGNLVNNGHWNHVWLNEGFNSYVENRIIRELYGAKRADLELHLAIQQLQSTLSATALEDQRLLADYSTRDPDLAFQPVNYVKGQLLLRDLAAKVGLPAFDGFLQQYFAHFAFQAINTADFVTYVRQQLPAVAKLPAQYFDEWFYQPGLPTNVDLTGADPFEPVRQLQQRWLYGDETLDKSQLADWTLHHWLYFINALPPQLSTAKLSELDQLDNFSHSQNAELFTAFACKAIAANYQPIVVPLQQFLQSNGRLKFILPLYQALKAQPQWRDWARNLYRANRDFYHPQARVLLDNLQL